MESYSVRIVRSAAGELEAVDRKADRVRLVAAISALSSAPRPRGCEKLAGHVSRLRIRVGDFRVVYSVDDESHVVEIVKIGNRREVYRK